MVEEPKIGEELKKMEQEYEPLLPVEKKLIAWSLGIFERALRPFPSAVEAWQGRREHGRVA